MNYLSMKTLPACILLSLFPLLIWAQDIENKEQAEETKQIEQTETDAVQIYVRKTAKKENDCFVCN